MPFVLGCIAALIFGQAWFSSYGIWIMLVLIAITVVWARYLFQKGMIK